MPIKLSRIVQHNGFTIVELLVVIVVIGVLAAITTISYTGIKARADDIAVQSDLKQFAMKVLEFQAINSRLPTIYGSNAAIEGIPNFRLSRSSYKTNEHNFYFCEGTGSLADQFAIGAISASGQGYYFSKGSVQEYNGAWSGSSTNCPGMGITTYSYAYGYNSSTGWWDWTQ